MTCSGLSSILEAWQGNAETIGFPLPDGMELHVKEYAELFMAHWDNISAIRNPLGD
jgi:hypothetical protein